MAAKCLVRHLNTQNLALGKVSEPSLRSLCGQGRLRFGCSGSKLSQGLEIRFWTKDHSVSTFSLQSLWSFRPSR